MNISIDLSSEPSEDNYNIYSVEKLNSIINGDNIIVHDIVIRGNEIKSLGRVEQVLGTLGIDSNSIIDFGKLRLIKGDLWVRNGTGIHIKSLGEIEQVDGDLNIKNTSIVSLGNLSIVGGTLNLRDTLIDDLTSLKSVDTLFLPKRIKPLNLNNISYSKVRYWSDTHLKPKQSLNNLMDVGGENLMYSVLFSKPTNDIYVLKNLIKHPLWDYNEGFWIELSEWKTPTNPLEKYYVSDSLKNTQEQNFLKYETEINNNPSYINQFNDNVNVGKLRDRLIYSLCEKLVKGQISCVEFLSKTFY